MSFEKLEVWKRSCRLSCEVYKHFHEHKDFGFKDQITRSSLSIASNIAEGYERGSTRDYVKFLFYAKGSCGELRTQVFIGSKIGYIKGEQMKFWTKEAEELSAMLGAMIRELKKKV